MNNTGVDPSLAKWRQGLIIYLTSQLTLLTVALVELPDHIFISGKFQESEAWIVLWLLLVAFGVCAGVIFWLFPSWRQVPIHQRVNTIFGFWGAAWVGCVALIFHNPLPVIFSFIIAGLGLIWLITFSITRRGNHKSEELFP